MTVNADLVASAAERIRGHVRRTPLLLSEAFGRPLAIKSEHLQRSSSFKIRGAFSRLLTLDSPDAGVITASTGNHGIGVSTAGRELGVPVAVCVAQNTDAAIIERLKGLGAEVRIVASDDCADAERAARRMAEEEGRSFVSPYNDPVVAAGQGSIAVELLEQLPEVGWDGVDAVVVAIGGGGLISGIATWLAHAAPNTRVVGAQPAVDAAMHASVLAGEIIDIDASDTLSHSTAGGIEDNAITFPICRDLVTDWIDVEEDAIADAVRRMLFTEHQLVEGAAGVALAACERFLAAEPDARVVVVSCGARLTPDELTHVLAH